jgi:hypothetical protein
VPVVVAAAATPLQVVQVVELQVYPLVVVAVRKMLAVRVGTLNLEHLASNMQVVMPAWQQRVQQTVKAAVGAAVGTAAVGAATTLVAVVVLVTSIY